MTRLKKKNIKKFKRVLVANRGEIALRIIRSLKELGMDSISVYSDEDVSSPHVYHSDFAVNVGPAQSSESYLRIDKIINAAKKFKADALHPGYGFLAENSDLVYACKRAGITFIGPDSKAMKAMGDKIEARVLMKEANIPIIPGTTEGVSEKKLKDVVKKIGYPILLKATAGGGGKGMRKVNNTKELTNAFKLASSEAKKSFSNAVLYVEKFIENPRHIEVQILADNYGSVSHVYNRECSVQRRHQKVIEEAMAPNLSDKTAQRMFEVAMNVSKAVGYSNAGTVEFIVDKDENFYFLEMNTRLQVEHPVTEMITGLDLVKEQIKIAQGEELFAGGMLPKANGSAIECRVYAENPAANFAPSPGKIKELEIPHGPFTRIDSGIWKGSNISMYYDPLISKLITWGNTRIEALERMLRALDEYKVVGVDNNIDFLKWILNNKRFKSGKINTNFIENEGRYKSTAADKNEIGFAVLSVAASQSSKLTRRNSEKSQKDENLSRWQHGFMFEDKI